MDEKISAKEGYFELLKVGNRGYTKGFFLGDNNSDSDSYDISKGLAGEDFLGIFESEKDGTILRSYEILFKNKALLNDTVEIITPNYSTTAKIVKIKHKKMGEVDTANTNDTSLVTFMCDNYDWQKEYNMALLRTKKIK